MASVKVSCFFLAVINSAELFASINSLTSFGNTFILVAIKHSNPNEQPAEMSYFDV